MHAPEKIGLIAGQGSLPELLLKRWEEAGFAPVVIGLDGITTPSLLAGREGMLFSLGQAGHILSYLKAQNVRRVVMAGSLKRPNFWTLRTDAAGLKLVFRFLFRKMGDDTLLRAVRREIEANGFSVAGVHEFLPEVLASAGSIGGIPPDELQCQLIRSGFVAAKQHGAADKGQSIVIAADGRIFYETEVGTDALLKSVRGLSGAVLVKVSKPQQDMALDMPTIGPETVRQAVNAGLRGIAIEAEKTLLLEKDEVVRLCSEAGLFLYGVEEAQIK